MSELKMAVQSLKKICPALLVLAAFPLPGLRAADGSLGADAYTSIHKALTERLAALEAQKELAFSTDLPTSA